MSPAPTDGAPVPSGVWAFVDEYGNANLNTDVKDVSERFIVSAVLVRGADVPALRTAVEAIRAKFFQTGEMKSKKLGSDRGRWVRLLTDLSPLPFTFYGLAVDKTRIERTSGLQWKPSFYKYLCARAYGRLMKVHPDLHVRADEHGSSAFMESFARYIRKNHRPTLFDTGTFEFVDGKSEVLVQLADIVCGLLARCYDSEKCLSKPEELLRLVGRQALLVDEWPVRYRLRSDAAQEAGDDEGVDERISRYSLRMAEDFIATNDDALDEEVKMRVAVVERLLFERRFGEGSKPVATGQILDNLRARSFPEKGETWLRRSVIAPLRDRGVLITSSSGGYKLPEKRSDMLAFVRHAEAVCIPMLNRVKTACAAVKLATEGEVEVLHDSSLGVLRKLVEALDDGVTADEPEEPWP